LKEQVNKKVAVAVLRGALLFLKHLFHCPLFVASAYCTPVELFVEMWQSGRVIPGRPGS
jgi:hypothetical protein